MVTVEFLICEVLWTRHSRHYVVINCCELMSPWTFDSRIKLCKDDGVAIDFKSAAGAESRPVSFAINIYYLLHLEYCWRNIIYCTWICERHRAITPYMHMAIDYLNHTKTRSRLDCSRFGYREYWLTLDLTEAICPKVAKNGCNEEDSWKSSAVRRQILHENGWARNQFAIILLHAKKRFPISECCHSSRHISSSDDNFSCPSVELLLPVYQQRVQYSAWITRNVYKILDLTYHCDGTIAIS
jgi:hypothetical protein